MHLVRSNFATPHGVQSALCGRSVYGVVKVGWVMGLYLKGTIVSGSCRRVMVKRRWLSNVILEQFDSVR